MSTQRVQNRKDPADDNPRERLLARAPVTQRRLALSGGSTALQQLPPAVIAQIKTSATLIWGRNDRVAPLRTAEDARSRYGWPLHVIDDAGHLSPVEQPQVFLRALRLALDAAPDEATQP